MNTWAALQYGGVETLGLCHGVQGGHDQLTHVIEGLVNKWKPRTSKGFKIVSKEEVDIICVGINHQTWYTQVIYEGEDWTGRLLEGFEQHPEYRNTEKVRIDLLRRTGYYTTESNGHVSEYVPWYRKRTKEIKTWIDLRHWIHGETGGYLRVCTENRNWFETEFPNWLKGDPAVFSYDTRTHEHGSWIIEGRETGRTYRGHFNVRNNGTITNLPDDAIVEVPCYVDKNGINVPRVGDLPPVCAAICSASVHVQKLAVEAAVNGDVDLLKQAFLMDPLIGAVCSPPEIWQMVDEMLVAQSQWLPQYKKALPTARKRLASEKALGTRKTAGAARLKTKSISELRKARTAARRKVNATGKAHHSRKKITNTSK